MRHMCVSVYVNFVAVGSKGPRNHDTFAISIEKDIVI